MDCFVCEEPTYGSVVRHPILGVRHVNCGKVDDTKGCPNCFMIPCECD